MKKNTLKKETLKKLQLHRETLTCLELAKGSVEAESDTELRRNTHTVFDC